MENDLTIQDKFLAKIGLKMEMERIINDKADFILYDKNKFKHIPVRRPEKSSQQKEMDHIYGMSDSDMIHIESGLRLILTIHESYYTETWKIKDIYIYVNNGTDVRRRYAITDADFEEEVFYSNEVEIPFVEVIKFEE